MTFKNFLDFVEIADEYDAEHIYYKNGYFVFYTIYEMKYKLKDYEKDILKKLNIKEKELNAFELSKIYNELSLYAENINDFIDKIIGKCGIIYYENNTFIFDNSIGHKLYKVHYKLHYQNLEFSNIKFEIKNDFDVFEFQKFINLQKEISNYS